MLATVHIIAGAAVGTIFEFWPLAFGISFAVHFLLDRLPHVDQATLKKPEERGSMNLTDLVLAFLDLAIGLGVVVLLAQEKLFSASVAAGVAGGILPDLPSPIYAFFPQLKHHPTFGWYYRLNRRWQGTVDKNNLLRGIIPTTVVVAIALAIIMTKST